MRSPLATSSASAARSIRSILLRLLLSEPHGQRLLVCGCAALYVIAMHAQTNGHVPCIWPGSMARALVLASCAVQLALNYHKRLSVRLMSDHTTNQFAKLNCFRFVRVRANTKKNQAMSALLCCGPCFDGQYLAEEGLIYHWLDSLLLTSDEKVSTSI